MNFNKEQILTVLNSIDFHKIKDHPNILIAANFWEEERFHAAKICYKYMRAIDDLIDNHKANNKVILPEIQNEFTITIENWLMDIVNSTKHEPLQKELSEIINVFDIPLWPFQNFAKSMAYDINNDGFTSLHAFLDYSQGASVAPASIFVHLCGLTKTDGKYQPPPFDVKQAATPCAIFSYLVHIIRDFQKDQLSNLNYFADDLIAKHGLTRQNLREFAEGKTINSNFRSLMQEYYQLADNYRLDTYDILQQINPLLRPRYRLSLEIIFELYLMVFERIDIKHGSFTSEELNPTPEEIKDRVLRTIMKK